MKENLRMTKDTARVLSLGLMEESIKEVGKKGNNMDLESLREQTVN